jgi:ribosomal protein S12 methylthiotransferase accessory factor
MEILITFPGGPGGLRVDADFGDGVVIKTDQPVKYGGGGTAPEPFKLFLASIGTCAGIYVLGFCRKNGIPTDGVSIVQRLESSDDGRGKSRLSKITLEIRVPVDFPEKYHDAIVRVADQCAVKKTIMDMPPIEVGTVVI